MKIERIKIDQFDFLSWKNDPEMGYALLYFLNEVRLCQIKGMTKDDLKWDLLTSGYLFNQSRELLMFRQDGNPGDWQMVLRTEEKTDVFIEERQILLKRFQINGQPENLVLRRYLAYDEDGQAFIKMTRLAGVDKEG